MKILFLCTEGDYSNCVINAVSKEYSDCTVVFEERLSKKKLATGRIKRLGLLKVAGQIAFLTFVPRRLEKKSKSRISEIISKFDLNISEDFREKVPVINVPSVNSDETIKAINEANPDIIIVNGTRIISKAILEQIKCPIINMHLGITPKYRGVHGAYWAVANGDFENCGVTVHMVNAGIDTGDVIQQKVITVTGEDNYVTYPYIQVGEGIKLELDILRKFNETGIIDTKRVDLPSKLWYHPTLFEYLKRSRQGMMCVSLDYELYWGMSDVIEADAFRDQINQTKEVVIPELLKVFKKYGIHATWAIVGGILTKNSCDYDAIAPAEVFRPTYANGEVSTYLKYNNPDIAEMFYYPESIELIKVVEGQEIGSHTFSHYYCTEKGQILEQFEADLNSAKNVLNKHGVEPKSIVFPRNQIDGEYLEKCAERGFTTYRGLEDNWIYNKMSGLLLRGLRLLDSYINLSGSNTHSPSYVNGMVNITGSRLYRPYISKLAMFEGLKLHRIKRQMLYAAKHGKVFHLWWHPHNFSTYTEKNLENLEEILKYYQVLKEKYGFRTMNMGEIAEGIILDKGEK
ncbi:Polysaccharide deacetylase [Pseudobutyrivibrio sp. UC1225]|uniref:formyltransferase family protein n=1 Tax=Pseudobutyrivibrio sp. UC1225 TaxID=1798185 RepID=UPI0008F0DAD8|nr:formyltransferase family protein [Pseudobutyrivibrio sp. UC1225]SFN78460.1 Polysaccharide deacetylase [Pseudobutyrivibrio sp. UC1225]